MGDEHLGKRGLVSKDALDFRLFHAHRHAFRHCGRRRQALRLSDQASFADEFVHAQDGDDRFLALLRDDGDFDFALLDVENRVRVIALRKDDFFLSMCRQNAAFGGGL